MVANPEAVAVVEGPRGKAEVHEVLDATGRNVEYQVRFAGARESFEETFKTLGEAYITAKEKAGAQ
jgi:hypothetical protein